MSHLPPAEIWTWCLKTQVRDGWRVISMTDTIAYLEQPKRYNVLIAAVVLLSYLFAGMLGYNGDMLFAYALSGFGTGLFVIGWLFYMTTIPKSLCVSLEDAQRMAQEQLDKKAAAK